MPSQLTHTFQLKINQGQYRDVTPTGTFRLTWKRDGVRFREEMDGAMTFINEDFYIIYSAPECAKFRVRCDFKGHEWNGIFTKMDCVFNVSKRFIEVTPAPDDDYRNFLPYIRMPMNIMQPRSKTTQRGQFRGEMPMPITETYDSDGIMFSTRWYETERIIETVTTPPTAGTGYSVNDSAHGTGFYGYYDQRNHSLIRYLQEGVTNLTRGMSSFKEITYLMIWMDHEGYNRRIGELNADEFKDSIRVNRVYGGSKNDDLYDITYPSMFTLREVINYYNNQKVWVRCELIYEREASKKRPPTGTFYESEIETLKGAQPTGLSKEMVEKQTPPAGWVYLASEKKWVRRPLNIGGTYTVIPAPFGFPGSINTEMFGDGTWYTQLGDYEQVTEGFIRRQELYLNKKAQDEYGEDGEGFAENWYTHLYGSIRSDRFHRIPSIINKFLVYMETEGADYFPVESKLLTEEQSPYLEGYTNDWYNVFIVQNSDLKRIESTEKATEQEFSFEEFMESVCGVMNAGWALINQKLVIEHVSYFDNGLSYNRSAGAIFNPHSIINAMANKPFTNRSNVYRFNHADMQKFEQFNTNGGRTIDDDGLRIIYDSPCANNYPDQNIREISLNLTLDAEYTIREGNDSGITLVKGSVYYILPKNRLPQAMYLLGIKRKPYEQYFFWWYPIKDERGVYRYNPGFSLKNIIHSYHTYGRSFKEGSVNFSEDVAMTTRHHIHQDLFFAKRDLTNPYTKVLTVIEPTDPPKIRIGRIEEASLNTRQGIVDMTVGYFESTEEGYAPPHGGGWYDIPNKSGEWGTLAFHRHVQETPSDRWVVRHRLNTLLPYKPVVYRDGIEIGYDTFVAVDPYTYILEFTKPVSGEAYFLAIQNLLFDEDYDEDGESGYDFYPYTGSGNVWTIPHGFGSNEVVSSVILTSDNREVFYENFDNSNPDETVITFTKPVTGQLVLFHPWGWMWDVDGSEASIYRALDYQLKPFVMRADLQLGYDTNILEEYLMRVGFTKEIIGNIIVIQWTESNTTTTTSDEDD